MTRALWVMTTITYGALVICAWGVTSLVLDEDVVAYSDAGPLLGPAMALAATLAVGGWMRRAGRLGGVGLSAVGAAASSWFAMLVVGSIGYTLTRGSLAWLLLFASDYATSAFTIVPAIIAAVLVGLVAALSPRADSFARH
jgi:hypothetical protein